MKNTRCAAALLVSASWLLPGAAFADPAAGCQPRNLAFDDSGAAWSAMPLSRFKRDTKYDVVRQDGRTVLNAAADGSASLFSASLKPPMRSFGTIRWDWMTDALVPGADNRDKRREDAPLRVMVAFDGDASKLPDVERKRFSRAQALARGALPYATLMYIWSDQVPVETVIPSAYTGQVRMLVVASGKKGLGQWQSVRRNLVEDYARAFGMPPGPVTAIAVMTDTDNTGAKATGRYAGIRIGCGTD